MIKTQLRNFVIVVDEDIFDGQPLEGFHVAPRQIGLDVATDFLDPAPGEDESRPF